MSVDPNGYPWSDAPRGLMLADAQSAAALPELLEALSALLAVAEMTTFSDSYPAECERARAALHKAGFSQ